MRKIVKIRNFQRKTMIGHRQANCGWIFMTDQPLEPQFLQLSKFFILGWIKGHQDDPQKLKAEKMRQLIKIRNFQRKSMVSHRQANCGWILMIDQPLEPQFLQVSRFFILGWIKGHQDGSQKLKAEKCEKFQEKDDDWSSVG